MSVSAVHEPPRQAIVALEHAQQVDRRDLTVAHYDLAVITLKATRAGAPKINAATGLCSAPA
jgi:hypothetical protein